MKILKEDIEKIAKLAMLKIENCNDVAKNINDFIKMAEVLNEIDTKPGCEDGVIELRCDMIGESLSQEDAVKNAPIQNDGYFIVPKTVEE